MEQSTQKLPNEMMDKDLCEECEVTRQATRNWRVAGLPYQKRGKYIVYQREIVAEWMQGRVIDTILSERKSAMLERLDKRVHEYTEYPKAAADDIVRNALDKISNWDDEDGKKEQAISILLEAKEFVENDYASSVVKEFAYDVQYVFYNYLLIPTEEEIGLSSNALFIAKKVIQTLYPDFPLNEI